MSESKDIFESQSYSTTLASGTSWIYGSDVFDPSSIQDMVRDPMGYNKQLRDMSRIVYNANGIVTNTIEKMVALPTLDKVIVPYGDSKIKKKNNQAKATAALNSLRDKEFLRDCIHMELVDGVGFYYVEVKERKIKDSGTMSDRDVESITEINEINNNIRMSAINLLPEYTKIIGLKNSSPVLAFDLSYFDNNTGGESAESKLKKFPAEIRNGYTKYSTSTAKNNWLVLNNDHTICGKFRSKKSEPWGRPLALAALEDVYFSDYFTETKYNVLDEVNNKIVYQTFPVGKEAGTSALSGKQQEAQHEAVKRGVTQKNSRGGLSFFSVAAGTKIDSIDTNIDILDEKNERNLRNNISTSLGFAESLLSGSGDSSFSSLEENLKLITATIFKMIEEISAELNKVLNACVIRDGKNPVSVVYLPITHANRKEFVGYAKEMYLQGKGSLTLWAAAIGVPPDAFYCLLDKEVEEDIENKYPVHKTSSTLSADDQKNGRPENTDPTNANTLKSKKNNSNGSPKPSAT